MMLRRINNRFSGFVTFGVDLTRQSKYFPTYQSAIETGIMLKWGQCIRCQR
ncbi:hypothetical protein ES703_43246 [subsurface metagenome]